jgi:phosphohistidine swiveling domain-containing protein
MEEPWLAALESVIVDACNREGIAQQDVFSDISKAGFFKPGEKVLFDTVINLGRLKLKTHHNFEPVMLAFNKLAGYISKESGVPIEHVNGMTCADIEGYLSTGKLQREEIKKRYEACVFLASSDGGFPRIGSQSEFAAWDAILEPKITGDIRGLVACRGRARGRVSLHLDWTAITEIPEGNVLVTGMTNPQMVPYMKHVSAIITDEGGLTCHAAIISREMKIPCIVGTKVATRVLKDGDVVEVDAEKGIVRVIK